MWIFNKVTLVFMIQLFVVYQHLSFDVDAQMISNLTVNALPGSGRPIPETLFGIFFEEINHAGAGGLWAELVSNRGFEAGGQSTPSNIAPWSIIGDESHVLLSTERSSCFENNKIALRMDVLCDLRGPHMCPPGGVGVYNPGYWGMNIEQGKVYEVIFYHRSLRPARVVVSLTSFNGTQMLATAFVRSAKHSSWTRAEVILVAKATDHYARLQLTTSGRGVIWFDQVSVMPMDTYKGHGFRNDLFAMMAGLQPRFLRFPGGTYVEGNWLLNGYRWKETIGPWENRPGHLGDVWNYWSDDGIGFLEYLQLAEDLNALPIWVFNNGISLHDQVNTSVITPLVQDVLDGIEFARGDPHSKWGSVRAKLGHPKPFNLRYVASGNEECGFYNYRGNYIKFYDAIKRAYPDIQVISNCDASNGTPLDHPAELYEFHIYTNPAGMFTAANKFDRAPRTGPKAFVSEYASTGPDVGKGNLIAALGDAAFLIGVERNSDAVAMASYAPLFVNTHDRTWNPDAIVFDSHQHYGTPSYWMQKFFIPSNGATLLGSILQTEVASPVIADAITWKNPVDNNNYLKIKVVNIGLVNVNLMITINGLAVNSIQPNGSVMSVLTSINPMDENSFTEPNKIVPVQTPLANAGTTMTAIIPPLSFTSLDLLLNTSTIHSPGANSDLSQLSFNV